MNFKGKYMRKNNLKMLIGLLTVLLVVVSSNAFSQDDQDTIKVKSIISKFKNYRFGTLNIYKLGTPEVLNDFKLLASNAKGAGEVLDTAGIPADIKKAVTDDINFGVDDPAEIIKNIRKKFGTTLPIEKVEALIKANQGDGGAMQIANAYVLTSRRDMKKPGLEHLNVIALIITTTDDGLERDLADVVGNQIFLKHEMESRFAAGNTSKRDNLLTKVIDQFYQGNIEDKTQEAQLNVAFAPAKVGVVKPFIPKDSLAAKYIQQFVKISDGQVTFKEKNHEVIISPDLISWKKYNIVYRKDKRGKMVLDTNYNKENFIWTVDSLGTRSLAGFRDPADVKYLIDTTKIPNDSLPKVGVELKYGLDDINYHSFWSERMTASIILENAKIGAILPFNILGSNANDLNGNKRAFTTAGYGVAGSFDMPIPLIKNSGIFNVSFGYVFGDAKAGKFNSRRSDITDPTAWGPNEKDLYTDYLVRYNMKLHYTVAMSIDNDWLIRFGIGAAGYSVENWNYSLNRDSAKVSFAKSDEKFIGGLSTNLDFMRINITTPFGAGLQYFSSGLGARLWWHIPLPIFDEESLAFRLEGKYFSPIFKKTLDPWEDLAGGKVVSLMGRLIIRL